MDSCAYTIAYNVLYYKYNKVENDSKKIIVVKETKF